MPSIQCCYSGTDHISSMPNVIAFVNFMITYTHIGYSTRFSCFSRFLFSVKHFQFVFHLISGATEYQIERMWCWLIRKIEIHLLERSWKWNKLINRKLKHDIKTKCIVRVECVQCSRDENLKEVKEIFARKRINFDINCWSSCSMRFLMLLMFQKSMMSWSQHDLKVVNKFYSIAKRCW